MKQSPFLVLPEKPKRPRWTGGQALVHVPLTRCPSCDAPVDAEHVSQLALPMLACGAGADRQTSWLRCPCGWSLQNEVVDTNPRRRAS